MLSTDHRVEIQLPRHGQRERGIRIGPQDGLAADDDEPIRVEYGGRGTDDMLKLAPLHVSRRALPA